jgi:hypothetical protein
MEAGEGARRSLSVYFGGGSPALMAEDLGAIMDALKESFDLRGQRASSSIRVMLLPLSFQPSKGRLRHGELGGPILR